jgi:hypothetical protein
VWDFNRHLNLLAVRTPAYGKNNAAESKVHSNDKPTNLRDLNPRGKDYFVLRPDAFTYPKGLTSLDKRVITPRLLEIRS